MRIQDYVDSFPEGFTGCLNHALAVYLRRHEHDTNPAIVQPILPDGRRETHWYYRSEEAIATSSWIWKNEDGSCDIMGFFEGSPQNLPVGMEKHFAKGRYAVDEMETYFATMRAGMHK